MPWKLGIWTLVALTTFGLPAVAGFSCLTSLSRILLHPLSEGGGAPAAVVFSASDLARLVSVKLGIEDREVLKSAFEKRIGFFGTLQNVARMEERLEHLVENRPSLDLNLALKGTRDLKARESKAPESQVDSLLLLLTTPSLKGLVWENSASNLKQLRSRGIDPIRFWNRHPPELVQELVDASQNLLGNPFLKKNLDPLIAERTGHSSEELSASPELAQVYTDEVAQSLIEALRKKQRAYPAESPKHEFIEQALRKLGADEEVQMEFTSRDLESFMGGKLAGDCTKLGKENDWTLGAWNLTFENMELRVKVNGKFFARVLFIASEREDTGGKPVLFAHAIEFSPLARPEKSENKSHLADAKVQRDALTKTFKFLNDHARRAGFDEVLVTKISNSDDYTAVMDDFAKASGMTEGGAKIRLLNPMDSAHAIQRRLRGKSADGPIRFLLQDWQAQTKFAPGLSREYVTDRVTLKGKQIEESELNRASNLFYHFIEDIQLKGIKKLRQLEVLLRTDPRSKTPDYYRTLAEKIAEADRLNLLPDHLIKASGLQPKKYKKAKLGEGDDASLDDFISSHIGELQTANLWQEFYTPEQRARFVSLLEKNRFSETDIALLADSSQEMADNYESKRRDDEDLVTDWAKERRPTTINSPVKAYSLKTALSATDPPGK